MSKQLPYRALGAETDQDRGGLHVKSLIHHEGPEGFLKGRNIEGGRHL